MRRNPVREIALATSLACLMGFGCAAAPAEHPPAAPAPAVVPSSIPVVASSSPVAATSALPAPEPASPRAPPQAGRERLSFAVHAKGAETKAGARQIGLSLDLPATWGIEPDDRLGPIFKSCRGAQEILGGSVMVSADGCEDGESKETCLDRMIARRHKDATKLSDADKPKLRRWVEAETVFDKGAGPVKHYSGGLYVYDPSTHAVARCGYFATNDRETGAFREICSTLAVDPAAGSAKPLAMRGPSPEGAAGNAAEIPHGDELAKVAKAFHEAVSKGDAAAAAKLGEGALCDTRPANKRAACKAEVAAGQKEFAKQIPKMKEAASKIEPAGFWFMPLSTKPDGPAVYFAYPLDAKAPCRLQMEIGWPVVWVEGRAMIITAARKVEKKAEKKK